MMCLSLHKLPTNEEDTIIALLFIHSYYSFCVNRMDIYLGLRVVLNKCMSARNSWFIDIYVK